MFVLRRLGDGAYLTRPGNINNYSRRLEDAWVFYTKQSAEVQCSEEEYLFPLGEHVLAMAA